MGTNNKLHEALMEARRFVFAAAQGQRDLLVNDGINEPYVLKPQDTLAKIDAAALAAPVKNCEVGSPEEQFARFKKFCARFDCCDCPVRKKWNFKPTGDESCLLLWTSMPYEGKDEVAEPPKKDEIKIPEVPPRLEPCPKCGKDAAWIVHPAFDGGSYVSCPECHFSPQLETWAPTDAEAAVKWNNLVLRKASADDGN